jgi:class 3 adenylate cyclase
LRGFTRLTQTASTATIEHLLNTLDTLVNGVARAFNGMVRFSVGDSYFLTFTEAAGMVDAAQHLSRNWKTASHDDRSGCGMHIVLHRGSINAFRTFLYGEGMMAAGRALTASKQTLTEHESGVFVTDTVRDELSGRPWHNRLRPLAVKAEGFPELEIYRLDDAQA